LIPIVFFLLPLATANGALGRYSLSLFCGPLVALEYRVLQREGSCTTYRDPLGRALAINKGVVFSAVDSALHHAGLRSGVMSLTMFSVDMSLARTLRGRHAEFWHLFVAFSHAYECRELPKCFS